MATRHGTALRLPHARRPADRTRGDQPEFHHILRQSADDVVEHHAAHRDFLRWIDAATRDDTLRESFASIEDALGDTDVDSIRRALVQAVEHRYLQ